MKDNWGHEVVRCPRCSVRVLPGQKFCSECGKNLGRLWKAKKGRVAKEAENLKIL